MSRKNALSVRLESDLNNSKKQCQDVMEENGRLTARVQAMTITAQSEQDVLAIEVSPIQLVV